MTNPIKIISKTEYDKINGKPNQEEIWDSISDLWSEYKKKPFFTVEDFLKNKKGKVIDLGCGCGRNMIATENLEYFGVDFSKEQLKSAEKITSEKKINAKFFKSCACKLDKTIFRDEMFDYGLFIATLHCIEGEKERENALKEFYRVLKKGAEGLISIWNSTDPRFSPVNYHGDIYMSWKINGKEQMRYYYLYSKEELIELLKKVGFDISEINTNIDTKDSMRITNSLKDRFSKKNWILRVKK
jgi:ubiquinone/menaquinone biosynthesis C-methylase UbiE